MPKKPKVVDTVDQLVEQLIEDGPFKKPTLDQIECNTILFKRAKLLAGTPHERIKGMRMLGQLQTAVIRLLFSQSDPKEVPIAHMKLALENPIHMAQFYNVEQRRSIDGPLRGIRVKCMECQGGDYVGVRECAAVNCPLWGFRMGGNPFHSRLSAEEADAESDETVEEMEALEVERNAE